MDSIVFWKYFDDSQYGQYQLQKCSLVNLKIKTIADGSKSIYERVILHK